MKQHLEEAVAETARVVEELKTNHQAKIEVAIAAANARLAEAAQHRERFRVDAYLGKPQAIAEIAKADGERASAENDLLNLRQALRDVTLRLVEAERKAENARRNLRQFEVKILQRERVEIAAEMDEARRNRERLEKIYDELGVRIIGMCDAMMHGVSDYEAAMGTKRRMSANLAASEARQWNLPPPVEATATKAA
jgi:hypothetical protein